MGLYFLIEKGAKADQSFSLKFSQNFFSLIRDIFFNIHVEISDEIGLSMLFQRPLPFTRCLLDTSPETDRISSFFWEHQDCPCMQKARGRPSHKANKHTEAK